MNLHRVRSGRGLALMALAVASLLATGARADSITVHLGTGGDDLRGGNDNVHIRVFDNSGRLVGEVQNANGRQRLADHTQHSATVALRGGVAARHVAAVELETTFGGGIGGDNWNLDSLRVTPGNDFRQLLFKDSGAPLVRFTGDSRVRRFTWVTHLCDTNHDCNDGVPENGAEICVGQPRSLDRQVVRQCAAGVAPQCRSGTSYSAREQRCVAAVRDDDGDGSAAIASGGDDCDDQDPGRHPGATELCDAHGKDEDCNFTTVGARDADGDGHTDAACFNWGPPPGR